MVRFTVVEEAVYDMLYKASALGYVADQPVDATKVSGSATAADNLEIVFATDFTDNYNATNNLFKTDVTRVGGDALETVTAVDANVTSVGGSTPAADALVLFALALDQATGQIDAGTLHDDAITAASIATGALTADAFAAAAIVAATLPAQLAASLATIVQGTVSHDATEATATVFYSDDITTAAADHYIGRSVIFTSGTLANQATVITDYELDTGEGKFTVKALTSAPADNVTFIIV
jgi:hypothetical protein